MEASTAGILKPSSLLAGVFWDVLLLLIILTWIMGFNGFSMVTPFGVCGGPERTKICVLVAGLLQVFSPDSPCQKDVFGNDGNSPSMDGTQVGVVKQPDEICLRCFLKT